MSAYAASSSARDGGGITRPTRSCAVSLSSPVGSPLPSRTISPPGGFGVRVDSAAYQGYTIPPHYDSMVAKLIVWGKDRADAIARTKRALSEFAVEGVFTTIPFHLKLLEHKVFISGHHDIKFLEEHDVNNPDS